MAISIFVFVTSMARALVSVLAAIVWCAMFSSAATAAGDDAAAIDRFIATQARREHGAEYRDARQIVVGKLSGVASPQTVVLYTIESQGGSNDHAQYLAVFVSRSGALLPVARIDAGGKSRRSVELKSITDGAIMLATVGYAADDASCCPSVKGTTRYVLVNGMLREERDSQR